MKYTKTSNKIMYDTLFEEVGVCEPTKEKNFKLRKTIKEILTLWQKEKYIKKFSEYKDGKYFKGIELTTK